MLIHIKFRPVENSDKAVRYIIADMYSDGEAISGPCGLHIREDRLQETIDRLDPDYLNDRQYIPGMPIDLQHTRVVQ